MMKFNAAKFKEKQEQEKLRQEEAKRAGGFSKDIHSSQIVKVDKAGEHRFRAFPYIHNADYESDPFADRTYHFGIPGVGPQFYCPQVNSGRREKCAVCDFVWEQMKANKGIKEETDKWKKFLPKRRILIPGILRGREKEGVKFFSLSTNNDKNSDNHDQLIKWLTKQATCDFLHPIDGCDMVLEYESYDAAKSKMLGGAKFGFKSFELDRDDRTPISDDPEAFWENIEKTLIDVDVDLKGFEKKTFEDSKKALEAWVESLDKKRRAMPKPAVNESRDNDGTSSRTAKAAVEEEEVADIEVDADDLPAKVEDTSKADRRARVKSLLAKPTLT